MGKGNRNRLDRTETVKQPSKTAPRAKKPRKPLGQAAKVTIACVLAFLIVAGIVVGALWSNGVFRSRTPLVASKTGEYDLTKASAAYLLWENQVNYMVNLYSSYFGSSSSTSSSTLLTAYNYALSGYRTEFSTPETLRTNFVKSKDSLTGYVAVCDIANEFGITLTKDEIKTAKSNAIATLDGWVNIANNIALSNLSSGSNGYTQKDYSKDTCSSASSFLKKYVASYITKADVQDAAVVAALYNKVLTEKNEQVEEALIKNGVMDAEQLKAYRDKNKTDFFSSDYISYDVTDKAELKELLLGATTAKDFKKLLAEYVGNDVYGALYNKYASGASEDAKALLDLITSDTKLDKDTLESATYGMTFNSGVKKDDMTDPDKVKTWITDSARKAGDKDTVAVTDDGLYAIVYISKSSTTSGSTTTDTYTYAVKKFDLADAPAEFKTDENFKQNIINSILIDLELIEETDDIKQVYKSDSKAEDSDSDSDDKKATITAAVSILKDMKTEINSALNVQNSKFTQYDKTENETATGKLTVDAINEKVNAGDVVKIKELIKELNRADIAGLSQEVLDRLTAVDKKSDKETYGLMDALEDRIEDINEELETSNKNALYKWLFDCKLPEKDEDGNILDGEPKDTSAETDFAEEGERITLTLTAYSLKKDGNKYTLESEDTTKVYCVVEPMKLDDEAAIFGGYLTFTGDDRETQAAEALEKLKGKSGIDLWRALQELGASTSYGFDSSDLSKMTELSKWMLSEDRKNGDMDKITQAKSESDSSSVDTVYVAVVIEKTESWCASAMSGAITEALEDWLEDISADYDLNPDIINALPEETTTEETTAATA